MATNSKKEILIDLFNLPPLPDERYALDAYMDVPHNFYIPDGKNTRLMDCVERREFERQTIDNNEGFVLQIPFLEHAFGTIYYVIDKQNDKPITVFIYKYGQMHYLSTGIRAHRETHPFTGFIAALEPKLNKMVVSKYADAREKPDPLEAIFQMTE